MQTMKAVKSLVREALANIHEEEVETIKEFSGKLNELLSEMRAKMDALADKRVDVLTDTTNLVVSTKVEVADLQQSLNEMSLSEISGASKPVDERYQQHGTAAWPRFWLHALLGCRITRDRISTVDRQLLGYLRDIRCRNIMEEDRPEGFEIEFYFAENPFFANASLKREIRVNSIEGVEENESQQASTIEWKNNTVELVEELAVLESGDEFEEGGVDNNTYGSFFDFFHPFEDVYLDMKMGHAIKERICSNPLKYAMRYEESKYDEKVEDSEPEDEEGAVKPVSGGRYPFSWLLSLAASSF